MNNDLTVVEDLLNGAGKSQKQEQPGRRDDAAENALPANTQSGGQAGPGPYYKSQKEVDAAFARRLEAERRKWARQNAVPTAPAMPQQIPTPMPPEPAAGMPVPLQAGAIGAAAAQPAENGDASGEMSMEQAAAANGNDALAETAMRLLAEEEDIKQVFPQFDLETFLGMGEGVRQALLAGRSLWSVFAAVYGDAMRRQAEEAAMERIRDRNNALPDVLRSGGAAGSAGPDYANMSSEQFGKLRKAYEAEMRKGKKVKP